MKRTTCFMMLVMLTFINLFFVCDGGKVYAAEPELKLEIIGGDEKYDLNDISNGPVYIAKVFYDGKLLKGEELKYVDLKWNPEESVVEIKKEYRSSHMELSLHNNGEEKLDPSQAGAYLVKIYASYVSEKGAEKFATADLMYVIEDGSKATDKTSGTDEENLYNSQRTRRGRDILWMSFSGGFLAIAVLYKLFSSFLKSYLGLSYANELFSYFYLAREDATKDAEISAELRGNTLSIEVVHKDMITGLEIDLRGERLRQLMPRALRKNIRVYSQSVCAFGNAKVEVANIGGTMFALNEKTKELQIEISDTKTFEITKDVDDEERIKIFGTMRINGVEEPFLADVCLEL